MGIYGGFMGFNGIYPKWETYKKRTGKIHHAINGKTHYFDMGHFQ
jgi:hypothetical protein